MLFLTASEYERHERQAYHQQQRSDYSGQVVTELDVARLVLENDSLYASGESDLFSFSERITARDFDLFQRALGICADFSEEAGGRPLFPRSALCTALLDYKLLRLLFPRESRASILEWGPGGGYLGLLLALEGYPYAGLETDKERYVLQSRLWSFATLAVGFDKTLKSYSKGSDTDQVFQNILKRFHEGAGACGMGSALFDLTKGPLEAAPWIVHCPWWGIKAAPRYQEPEFEVLAIDAAAFLSDRHLGASLLEVVCAWMPGRRKLSIGFIRNWDEINTTDRELLTQTLRQNRFTLRHEEAGRAYFVFDERASLAGESFLSDRIRGAISLEKEQEVIGREQIDVLYQLLEGARE